MAKIMVFGGTTEGRLLTEALSRWLQAEAGTRSETEGAREGASDLSVFVSVATEYGRDVLQDSVGRAGEVKGLQVLTGRLDETAMGQLLVREQFDLVIDTTHPYALAVTETIHRQCRQSDIPYLRVLRQASGNHGAAAAGNEPVYVNSSQEAAEFLNSTTGPVFLTTGSKELAAFTAVQNYQERLFARVLPMPGVVEHCLGLGFSGRQLICMQGPFTTELNMALLKQSQAAWLVSKDSGANGGFAEKQQAAEALGVRLLIIGRNPAEEGVSLAAAVDMLNEKLGLAVRLAEASEGEDAAKAPATTQLDMNRENSEGDWFPLFIKVKGKQVVVAGGGKIAKRRIRNLTQFSLKLTVVASEPSRQVRELAAAGRLVLIERPWEMSDLAGADWVVAATNDRQVNRSIFEECKRRGILVNVADCKDECDFYFPGIVRQGDLTIGITAEGKNHSLAKQAKQAVAEAVKEL